MERLGYRLGRGDAQLAGAAHGGASPAPPSRAAGPNGPRRSFSTMPAIPSILLIHAKTPSILSILPIGVVKPSLAPHAPLR